MRFLRVLLTDMRYQFKYGFYMLYVVISALYVAILFLLPSHLRQQATALVVLTDPAQLGFIFIGGIMLLEKGEGLHSYFSIVPVTIDEYILAKALSLSVISTLAGVFIAAFALAGQVNYLLLTAALLFGSAVFTWFGLGIGSVARSVNHYLVIGIPAMIFLLLPPGIAVFGVQHLILEIFPGTLLLRIIYLTVGLSVSYNPAVYVFGLILWGLPAYWFAKRQFSCNLQRIGG